MSKKMFSVLAALALFVAACGDDDDDASTDDTPTNVDDGTGDGTGDEVSAPEPVTVTAIDYGYEGLPATVPAGTELILQNSSEGEYHEILAFRLADDETRPVAELMALPQEELEPVLGGPPIPAVAPPGAVSTDAPVPPAILADPGRYVIACFIPTGAPPDEVGAAIQAYVDAGTSDPAGPAYPETGPPHAANGMFGEVTVG